MPRFREAFVRGRQEALTMHGFGGRSQTPPVAEGVTAAPALTIRGDYYGQFYLAVEANGTHFRCLVDTGASWVVFRRQDAASLGLDPARLAFTQAVWTANGSIHCAAFRLRRLVIASCVLTDISASINGGELQHPLLGMSALRLMKVTVGGGSMTLRW
jgi:clan AA aspartic protease (TIGR02281 family)